MRVDFATAVSGDTVQLGQLQVIAVFGKFGPNAVFMRVDTGGIWFTTKHDSEFEVHLRHLGLFSRKATESGFSPSGTPMQLWTQAEGVWTPPALIHNIQRIVVRDDYDQAIALFGCTNKDGIWMSAAGEPAFDDRLKELGLQNYSPTVTLLPQSCKPQ